MFRILHSLLVILFVGTSVLAHTSPFDQGGEPAAQSSLQLAASCSEADHACTDSNKHGVAGEMAGSCNLMHCNFHFICLGQLQQLDPGQFGCKYPGVDERPLFAADHQRSKRPPRIFS